jgi:hypothetical protein
MKELLMSTISTLSSGRPGEPRRGAWPLEAGRIVRLRPREDTVLRAGHGQLWITFDRPQEGALNESGDFILAAGQRLHVAAGQMVVISAFGKRDATASFDWELPRLPQQESWNTSFARFVAAFTPRALAPAR